jgi:outer membrane protein
MKTVKALFASAVIAAFLAGCATIREAHEAQEALAYKGDDGLAPKPCERVDLRDASLAQLVGFALTNRPSIASKVLAVEDARLALRQLAANAPVLSESPWTAISVGLSGKHSESSEALSPRHGGEWKTSGGASAVISLDLLIWDFGRYDASARAQVENVLAAEYALAAETHSVCRQVAVAYFDLMEHRALLEVAFTNRQQYAEHLVRAEESFKAGEANRLDMLKARLDLARARQVVVTASNRVDTTGASLMLALGIDASRGTCAECIGCGSVGVDSVRRGFARTTEDVEDAFAFARTNAPAVRLARARLRSASHSIDYAIADLMPKISASTSFSWTDPLWYWSWGFSAAQSLISGGRDLAAVDRAVVAFESAAVGVDAVEQQLSVDLETAIANRDNSAQAVASAVAAVRSAKENLDTVREQFAVGSASRVDLSDAIAADSQARGDCISAFYDGQRAEAELFAILGSPQIFTEETVRGEIK